MVVSTLSFSLIFALRFRAVRKLISEHRGSEFDSGQMLAKSVMQILSDPALFGAADVQQFLLEPAPLGNVAVSFENDGVSTAARDQLKAGRNDCVTVGLGCSVQFPFPKTALAQFRLDLWPGARETGLKQFMRNNPLNLA